MAEKGVCVVDQCLTNSMVGKGTTLYRIPKVRAHYGEYELELSQRRRNGFLLQSVVKTRRCNVRVRTPATDWTIDCSGYMYIRDLAPKITSHARDS